MANIIFSYSYLILLFPFLSFLILVLGSAKLSRSTSSLIAIVLSAFSLTSGLALSTAYYTEVLCKPILYPDKTVVAIKAAWLNFTPSLTADMGIYLDPISVMMIVVITFISFLVNIYSVGYMKQDAGFTRFFALLALFSFSMLGLVVSTNICQMFVFWELVGVSSYSLIGFWYEKPSAVAASKKAFIVTRFADAFFLLGIIVVSYYGGSFDFQVLNNPETASLLNRDFMIGSISFNLLTVATLLIFTGGWGKSAMFPLHIWLPDAMEGPTPVSSIIHSATMVVAGVYLTARMFPLFAASETTLAVAMTIGSFTALFAAVIAITQKDIKRILAFSTLSQLGYMMFSLGASKISGATAAVNTLGYSAAMFHVFTHAFFKCMLFLGAGAVIHAVHSNNIDKMGGLKNKMPITYWSLLTACLAISGIFPFAGFWSKDEILLAAFQSGHHITFATGLFVGGLTAFYMFRFFFLTFHGKARSDFHDIQEDPCMTFSIAFLVIPTIIAGFTCRHFFAEYVLPPTIEATHLAHPSWLPYIALLSGLTGLSTAWILYGRGETTLADTLRAKLTLPYKVIHNKFYIDELYLLVTKQFIFKYIADPIKWFDKQVVDGLMNLTGKTTHLGGNAIRYIQSGKMRIYLSSTVLGLIALLLFGL